MTGNLRPWIFFDLRLSLTWHCLGTDYEAELFCWLRSSLGSGKLLVVQAANSTGPDSQREAREFIAQEHVLDPVALEAFLDQIDQSGILDREFDTTPMVALEEEWGARVGLSVTADGRSTNSAVTFVFSGIQGADADRLTALLSTLLDLAGIHTGWARRALTSTDGNL